MAEGDGRTTCSGGSEEEEESDMEEMEEEAAGKDGEGRVYLPGLPLAEGEELVREESAYRLFQRAQTGAPCLSFDIVRDNLGEGRTEFPLTLTLCAGTQADTAQANRLLVMKMHNLWGNKPRKETSDGETDSESESESSGDEEEGGEGDRKPRLEIAMVPHHGGINRVRVSELRAGYPVAAVWGDTGRVEVWELQQPLRAVADAQGMRHFLQEQQDRLRPLHSFAGHMGEGFALDWSPTAPGRLATGDCKRNIHVWEPVEGGTWNVDQRPYTAHSRSVEDIQWSPNEPTVFASCSADASIRVWDTRVGPARGCMLTEAGAHGSDVNVISWNQHEPFICSGGDDGLIRIWDLRHFGDGVAVASFKLHSAPVTTVEWSAAESSVVAAAGADDVLSQWDLSVERDGPGGGGGGDGESGLSHLPPQLLFIHQGQRDIKELHWHPQCPGLILSTALSGFDVFRTLSV